MKEVMIILRPKMYFPTKEALDQAGFHSMTIREIIGRGKCPVHYDYDEGAPVKHRLVAKRMIDHLGHGASVKDETEWGYFAENPSDTLVADMHSLRTTVQGENPGIPYFMMGHSMGSYMLRKYLCLHGENLSGAVIMGTGCVPDGTMKFGMTLCKFLAFFRGWNYRSKLVQKLSYSKPYHKFDLYGKELKDTQDALEVLKRLLAYWENKQNRYL